MRGFFLLLIFFNFSSLFTKAQKNVALNEVKKINLLDLQWSPLGINRRTEFEIVNENGNWKCYQTKQAYNNIRMRPTDNLQKENSTERKFVKPIDEKKINSLLSSVRNIKPHFNWKIFNITSKTLLRVEDSLFMISLLKKFPVYHQMAVNDLKKKSNIKQAINFLQFKDYWTDDYPTCVIEIIKTNNDTVKIVSHRQMDFMLPWMIGNTATYDLNINRFFTAAMGDYAYSNKKRLNGGDMPRKIMDYIGANFTEEKKTKYDWQTKYPNQYKTLTDNFTIGYQAYQGIVFSCTQLPANFYFSARIEQNDSKAIENLIKYKDTIIKVFKRNNFVFQYYKNSGQIKVRFYFAYGQPFRYRGFLYQGKDIFNEWLSLPENKGYKKDNIIRFEVEKDNRMVETWLILPDNKVVRLITTTLK
jgi:hypothetical protein